LLINPRGLTAQGLTFLVDADDATPGVPRRPLAVQALDESGEVAATADAGRGGLVRLDLPLRPDRINRFRLRLQGNDASSGGGEPTDGAAAGRPAGFRVGRAGGTVPFHGKYARRRPQSDVAGDGLVLGRNWRPPE